MTRRLALAEVDWGAATPTLIRLPDREAWIEARRSGLGASDAAAILGVSPYATALEVFVAKLGLLEDDTRPEPEPLLWGRLLEPLVADHYAGETHRVLAEAEPWTILVHPAVPYVRATLDRVIVGGVDKPVPAPLELKTTNIFAAADDWAEEPPVHVQVQGQHQLYVTGAEWVSFAVLVGGQRFLWCDMPRNERFIAILAERLRDFWRRVDLREPPQPTAGDKEVLAALYPTPEVARVALPDEALEWDRVRADAVALIREATALRAEAENRLRAAIGPAEEGVLPGGAGRYSWRLTHRPEVVQPATSFRVLRRHVR